MPDDVSRRPSWPRQVRVEQGKCMELARALRATEGGAYLGDTPLTAVPTFPVVVNLRGATGTEIMIELGCDPQRVLHGSEEYFYPNGPLTEGQELAGAMTLISRTQKMTKSGRAMTVFEFETELRDVATGDIAVLIRRSALELGHESSEEKAQSG
jgi:hypothetical protein